MMNLFLKDLIKVNYKATDKVTLLAEMVEFLYAKKVISDKNEFIKAIMERENIMSTGIGRMIAIPHAYSDCVKTLAIPVFSLDKEIDFDALDDLPVKIVFMIAVPIDMKKDYMKILAAISNFLSNPDNHSKLLSAKTEDELYNLLKGITI